MRSTQLLRALGASFAIVLLGSVIAVSQQPAAQAPAAGAKQEGGQGGASKAEPARTPAAQTPAGQAPARGAQPPAGARQGRGGGRGQAAPPTIREFPGAPPVKQADFKTKDGAKIHYLETGTGPDVVFIHGAGSSAIANWYNTGTIPEVAKNHHVVALDCRGHGASDAGSPRATDVIELMDLLKIEKAHIGGYSMGGGLTNTLIRSNPERFTTAIFGGSSLSLGGARGGARGAKGGAKGAPGETAKTDAKAPAKADDKATTAKAPAALPANLEKIAAIPVLVINGSQDGGESRGADAVRYIKDHKVVVVPDKAHFTAPGDAFYTKSIVEWINAHDVKK